MFCFWVSLIIVIQEQWLAAKGTPVKTPEINSWRRKNMDNLVGMFDFAHASSFVDSLLRLKN